jgi:glycosyltransferase involved in cell wall biosynthesis
MTAISVIVPVYNVAAYLAKCMDSILSQTFRDFEVIIVNDGTKDNSREIAAQFVAQDRRIRLIDQENQGLGYARNTALNVAQGEYVSFVDSDDWLDPGYLEAFYLEAERTRADLVIGTFMAVASNEREITPYYLDPVLRYRDVPFHWSEARQVFLTPTPVWDKFYRRRLIEENKFRFPKLSSEDIPFKWQTFTAAQRISTLPEPFYYYRVRRTSLTGGKGNAIDVFRSHDVARRYLQSKGLYEDLYPEWVVREVSELIYLTVKAKAALLSDPLFFNAFHALLGKALQALDFDRARQVTHYISDEYMFRAQYVIANQNVGAFRQILKASKHDQLVPQPRGLSLRIGARDLQLSFRRAEESPCDDNLDLAPEFFTLDTVTTCWPERYPDEPRYCPAMVTDNIAYLLPPINDPAMPPAYVSLTITAPRALSGFVCMAHTHQRERTITLGARAEVLDAETGRSLGHVEVSFPTEQWYKLMHVRFPEAEKGRRLEVRISALNGGTYPAYYSGIRFYNFAVE